jgi:hypothetical protein
VCHSVLLEACTQLWFQLSLSLSLVSKLCFQAIRENQVEFLAMVNAPPLEPLAAQMAAPGGAAAAPGGAAVPPAGPGVAYVRVTPEEREAIERVGSLPENSPLHFQNE